jgi:hypothetical protein
VLGFHLVSETGRGGSFSAVLPYGQYAVRAPALAATCRVRVRPLAVVRCDLHAGEDWSTGSIELSAGDLNAEQYLLQQIPGAFSYPLDFANLGAIRLPLVSGESVSWTATRFRLNGLDATDSYQPGTPAMLDNRAGRRFGDGP